ncbi:MAG TPA: SDR family NAD(P)-dependent oxidoreductase [Methylomirabilota bacterium]|jgi:NAD(P)-dependent dehydrogenase (short-subunit alcohol dehydrogenase family)|nr:SDR family NAD(P)-dependent oxidoreductase [Methylomirabilota bacterium]
MVRSDRLKGQVAIVTGACGGIGRATCLALAAEGATVSVVDVAPERVQALVNELEAQADGEGAAPRFLGLALDVRRESDMHEMAAATLAGFGRIDILVAAAGVLRPKGTPPRLLAQMPLSEWDEVLDTNLRGVFLSNRAVLPVMIRQRAGQIVNVSSVQGRQGHAYDSAYCASKFGVIGLSESLAEEVRGDGVRVQVLLPDAVETPMWSQNGPIPPPAAMLPAARVAEFIVYLLTLPEDTVLVSPVIAPFRRRRRTSAARNRQEAAEETKADG